MILRSRATKDAFEKARRAPRLHVVLRQAAVEALKKFPVVNASVDGNDIVYHNFFDIGVAVGSPRPAGRADPAQRRTRCRSRRSRTPSGPSARRRRTAA